jgi:hypothetical protein
MQTIQTTPVRVPANNTVTKRLGNWTDARTFEVHAHRGQAVLDLRSPRIPAGDVEVEVDLDHATLTLLVADDAVIDDWNLRLDGRGRVKDTQRPAPDTAAERRPEGDGAAEAVGPDGPGGRRVAIIGQVRQGEIRVHRGGIAILSAMFSREYLADLRRAHRDGGVPTVDDPTRTA